MAMRCANVSILKDTGRYVILCDNGPWDIFLSITNDAEGVIERLGKSCMLDRKVYYYDSGGEFGELKHDGHKFTGFGHADREAVDKEG